MNCLYCGKPIEKGISELEIEVCWHKRCIKSFFASETIPILDITESRLKELIKNYVDQGITVTGVQKKLSLGLSGDADERLAILDHPAGYILKPQTKEYDSMPEFEDLAMRLADLSGIKTVPHALIKMNSEYAYITRRIDRDIKDDAVKLFAMEDFCQLSGRLTQDKYKGSYEGCGRVIKEYSTQPGLDLSELFLRVVFSFIIGNSDMHLKNFSLREKEPAGRDFFLSEAYDMLPVNIILPEDKEQLALTINGKKKNIKRKDFMKFAHNCDISEKPAHAMLDKLCSLRSAYFRQCDRSYLNEEQKLNMKELITDRIASISE